MANVHSKMPCSDRRRLGFASESRLVITAAQTLTAPIPGPILGVATDVLDCAILGTAVGLLEASSIEGTFGGQLDQQVGRSCACIRCPPPKERVFLVSNFVFDGLGRAFAKRFSEHGPEMAGPPSKQNKLAIPDVFEIVLPVCPKTKQRPLSPTGFAAPWIFRTPSRNHCINVKPTRCGSKIIES